MYATIQQLQLQLKVAFLAMNLEENSFLPQSCKMNGVIFWLSYKVGQLASAMKRTAAIVDSASSKIKPCSNGAHVIPHCCFQ
jgi:hypothetical protein